MYGRDCPSVESPMNRSEPASQGNMETQIASSIHYTVNESNNLPPLSASVPANLLYDNKEEHSPGRSTYDDGGADHRVHNSTTTDPNAVGAFYIQSSVQVDKANYEETPSSSQIITSNESIESQPIQEARSSDTVGSYHSDLPSGPDYRQDVTEYDSEEEGYTLSTSPAPADHSQANDDMTRPKPFSKKNLKRHRETRFLLNQFGQNPHPDAVQRGLLAKQINGLTARQIQVWFQNRRAKLKRMSAADADRMLSTRSYPDGYGPQGFTDRSTISQETTHPMSYAQSVEGVYTGHLYLDRHLYHSRSTPPVIVHHPSATPSFVGHESARTPQSAVYPSHYDRGMSHSPLPDRSIQRRFEIRSTYGGNQSQYPDARAVQGRESAPATVSTYDRNYGQSHHRPAQMQFNMQENIDRNYNLLPHYPSSAPPVSQYTSLTSSPFLQPEHGQYWSNREYQGHGSQDGRLRPFNHENACLLKDDGSRLNNSTYELQAVPGTYLSPSPSSRVTPSFGYNTMEQSATGDPEYSDVRHSSHDQYQSHTTDEYRTAVHQHDVHYYYGTEAHLKHENDELQEARRLFQQQKQGVDRGQECPRVPSTSYADAHGSMYAQIGHAQGQFDAIEIEEAAATPNDRAAYASAQEESVPMNS